MITRRQFAKALLVSGAAIGTNTKISQLAAATPPESLLGDDGLYHQPWFMQSFLVLAEDLQEVTAKGLSFAIVWEQRDCPYCKQMHVVNLANPEISDYLRKHFGILQLNIWGAREVTDFDGETLPERQLSQKWRVNFTPTIQFFPPQARTRKSGLELEVVRMPGYFKPFHFISMFEFVHERAYERMSFQSYLQEKVAALQSKGIKPKVW